MKIYLDTNVYQAIARQEAIDEIQRLRRTRNATIIASSCNLFEILAITDLEWRKKKMSALTAVANEFESQPESWHHAREVRFQIAKHRPGWLCAIPRVKQIRQFLAEHRMRWELVKRLCLPDAADFANYKRDSDSGKMRHKITQQFLRSAIRDDHEVTLKLPTLSSNNLLDGAVSFHFDNPEQYWRLDCLQVWHNALVCREPAMRDYCDWLDPYITGEAYDRDDFQNFWLKDVEAERMPKNRITGLTAYYQLRRKVTNGNALDTLHANRMLDVEVFFTSDVTFYEVLCDLKQMLRDCVARPVLVDQVHGNITSQIEQGI